MPAVTLCYLYVVDVFNVIHNTWLCSVNQGGALKLPQKLNNIMTSFATYPDLVTFQNDALPQWMRAGILLVAWFRIYPTLTSN